MSAPTIDHYHLDETACGPLCQHPQCWASNRRMERGLPRVAESLPVHDDYAEDSLPMVKVFNLLDQYGDSEHHQYHCSDRGKDTATLAHGRSASAPNIMAATNTRSPVFAPFTPFTSPLGIRGGSVRSTKSAKNLTRSRSKTSPKISHVQMMGDLQDFPSLSAGSSSFYMWCPSKKSYEKHMENKAIPQNTSNVPVTIQPRNLTDDMVPDHMERRRTKQKKDRRAIHETPTGGRPYTHPTRSPPPVARRTLPQDIDDGINQLLNLPKDVLMDVLDHIKKSDLLDKRKVQLLLSRIMPHIHFQQDSPSPLPSSVATRTTPLQESSILQNRKVTLHNQVQKTRNRHEFPDAPGKIPFLLEDPVITRRASSTCVETREEPVENLLEKEENMGLPIPASIGRMPKTKPLAPIKASRATEPLYKLTSVSARSFPPLKPGMRSTKPFDYTNTEFSLDLTLVPLPQPEHASPEIASMTPYSLMPSTLHVTVPSVPSPDRTVNSTPVMAYNRSPAVPHLAKPGCTRSLPSPFSSEDVNTLHALSHSVSTRVPKTPQDTSATALCHKLYSSESHTSKISSDHHGNHDLLEARSSPTPKHPSRTVAGDSAGVVQDVIHEAVNATTTLKDSVTGLYNRSGFLMSPSKQPLSSVSPNDLNGSAVTHGSEKDAPSVGLFTPAPTSTTPESWPNVDEHDFLRSPDKGVEERLATQQTELPAPVAPPPSPEPRDANQDFDFQVPEVNNILAMSLTPLAEEEELNQIEKDKANDIPQFDQDTPPDGHVKFTETDVEVKKITWCLEDDTTHSRPPAEKDAIVKVSRYKTTGEKNEQSTESQHDNALTIIRNDMLDPSAVVKALAYSEQKTDTTLAVGTMNNETQSDDVTGADTAIGTSRKSDVTDRTDCSSKK